MKGNRRVCGLIFCFTIIMYFLYIPVNYGQKNSGAFYTTIFAKTGSYSRINNFGQDAKDFFLEDVNGDGKDDAVIFNPGLCEVAISDGTNFKDSQSYLSYDKAGNNLAPLMGDVDGDGKSDLVLFDPAKGNWEIALSTGNSFSTPVVWTTGDGVGSTKQFLADVNGDKKDDAVIFFRTGLIGHWYVGLSSGNRFKGFSRWITGFGENADQYFMGDVNGDGKDDALHFTKSTGNWGVATSNGSNLVDKGTWKTSFGINVNTGLVADIDGDSKSDIIHYHNGIWMVSYSTGNEFTAKEQRWITGHRPATMISRGNKPEPEAKLIGSLSGNRMGACVVSDGEWLYLENASKEATVDAVQNDTWGAWGNQYLPQVGGTAPTYDAGDTDILDQQIKMLHDAGFTYLMLDITNGIHPWIDNRAKKVIDRLRVWNDNLQAGQHKVYYCISMGGSRGMTGTQAADAVESESKRTWIEFYERYPEGYYQLNGKPLIVHFVWDVNNSDEIISLSANMTYYQKFTARWMYNEIKDQPKYANAYGWPLLTKFGNPKGEEVMDVSPGFWNGAIGVPREQGEFYRSLWMRVLQYDPQSVWLNSFNESWEHTSVEPAYLPLDAAEEFPKLLATWTDYYGERMDNFYWVMTKQYNRLFMYDELFLGCYMQEHEDPEIYVVTADGIEKQGAAKPRMAPVLLVPKGYISRFVGTVIDEELNPVGKIEKEKDNPQDNFKSGATNIITPNGDGFNDRWIVSDIEKYPKSEVRVKDRNGKLVFLKKGYQNDWGGNYSGGVSHGALLPEGVYLFTVDYGDKAKKPLKGHITILHQP